MTTPLSNLLPKTLVTQQLTLELYEPRPEHVQCYLASRNNALSYEHVGDPGCYTQESFEARHNAMKLLPSEFRTAIEVDCFIVYVFSITEGSSEAATGREYAGFASVHQREGKAPELGYHLITQYMGRGYATEATKVVVVMLKNILGLKRLTARVSEQNIASQRVVLKAGFLDTRVEQKDDTGSRTLKWFEYPMS